MTIALVMVVLLGLIGGVGYAGLKFTGYFTDDSDYSNTAGTGDVLVQIPQDATLTRFGEILHDRGVVASVAAFVSAADNKPISAGFYKLRTGIPATRAVAMLGGDDNRVGRLVIPAGRQLDTKKTADGKNTVGIFAMLADATTVTINGKKTGPTPEQLAQAAATASPADLGVPEWATADVAKLTGDHRRIEGLIAPIAWESIDPALSPTAMLKYLIVGSARYFEQWGLLNKNPTGLSPYQALVSASVVEREVSMTADYGKVARVITNRLGRNQKLEMDSTANYTAAVVNIDVFGDAYTAETKWNTYRVSGLPATPIGAVGRDALTAALDPPAGNWVYFVTVDAKGTTLFTPDYEQHLRNRQLACSNKILTTGCQ
ncbi:endolytic transglycosylase MltG [Williamsia sp. CHRR-6]|uniref:endolytic transglycosylase MltG n=1 Tax=Williamsia sp. CHRR-6 TaxID=2835871 RepID=UPI0027DDC5B7|nr:endolytic transglycosylase MltG [Williamsia sp. CHRR-6]